jgi:ABC-type branched-subunit amino acid transport system substrate-binding protein
MVRVAPSNAQEIDAALRFIKPQAKTAFLIQDTNPDDTYDTTIVKEFQDSFPDATHALAATESYNSAGEVSSSDPAGEEVANRLGLMPSDICESGAGLVLFAGRGRDLGALITDLGERPCLNKRITILTADDVTNMPVTAPIEKGLRSGVTLDYAGLASPSEWTTGTGGSWQGYTQFSGAFGSRFPRVSYSDGNAMMGYDATLTAISAIRLASVQHIVRSPLGVAQVLSALQGSRVVPGASGPISFSANNGPQGSNPVGKVIPIFQIQPSGAITFVHLES